MHVIILGLLMYGSLVGADPAYTATSMNGTWGFYYEQIGDMLIANVHWRLFIRTDLEDLQIQRANINNLFKEIQKLCQQINDESLDRDCLRFITQAEHSVQNINLHDTVLKELLGISNLSRSKRGLLNVIGTVSKQLFGTLDETDAQSYKESLSNLQEDQINIKNVLTSQTRILEKVVGEFNSSFKYIVDIQDHINNVASIIYERSNQIASEMRRMRIQTLMIENFDTFMLLVSQYKFSQTHLFDILETARHGHLHPYVISPDELLQEFQEIQKQFTAHMSWPVPVTIENINSLLQIIQVKVYVDRKKLVYLLQLPVITHKPFSIHQVSSLPKRVKENIFSLLIPEKELLVVGKDKHYFIRVNKSDLKECTKISQKTYVCDQQQEFEISYSKHSCEFELFFAKGKLPTSCRPRSMMLNSTLFIQLYTSNSWIYVAPFVERAEIECGNFNQHENFRDVGLIQLTEGCELRTSQIVLAAEKSFEHNLTIARSSNLLNFDSIWNKTEFSNLTVPISHMNLIRASHQIPQLTELSHDIESISQAHKILFNKRQIQISHWSYGSSLVFIFGILVMIIWYLRYRRSVSSNSTSSFSSHPAAPKPRRRMINEPKDNS